MANNDNTVIALAGVLLAFTMIVVLLYKLDRDKKLRQNAKNDLAVNELKYRNLIENAGIVMYTTSLNGSITFASSKAFQLTGYSMKELIGMHFSDIIDIEWLEIIKERYKSQVKNNIEETLFEFGIRTKFGDLKWVEQSAVLITENSLPIGFQCIIKDISESKEMEDVLKKYEMELVQNQERLQSILDNTTSLIYIKDLEGKYLLTNKQFKEVFDIKGEDVIGKTAFDFTESARAQRFTEVDDEVIRTGKAVEIEEIVDKPEGRRTLLIIKFPLINAQNEIYGISGIGTDISDRVKHRQELIEAKKVAEDAKRLQEQFLANMSHEIRTPMNGIQGMTDLLLETSLTDEQSDFAKSIKRSTDNLVVIINDILDFSKIKAGKLTIEKIDFELNEVVENIQSIFKHRILEKGLTLQLSVDENVPATLNGDPYRLNQILVNLVGNAIKFTHQGGIKIHISIKEKSDKEVALNFKITDTGIGIQEDKISQIFESFTQASVETSRKYGGSGLGLAITKQLLEMQNGEISVESVINIGTSFQFFIPYQYNKTTNQLFFRNKNLKNYNGFLQGKKFLVAEDNEVNQKVIRHVLQKAGGVVDIANNGLEAIAFLKKSEDYNLIIMDLQMPEMDGYAATKYIRNVMNIAIPIMAMTASALKGEKTKCIEIGMSDYLTKPFNFSFLYERINILLEKKAKKNAVENVAPQTHNNLFDLSLLEEMDDNEYSCEILSIFLNNTPVELNDLHNAALRQQSEDVYKIAHKLKSSTGLLKANEMLTILVKIEEQARENKIIELPALVKLADAAFRKIESPLQKHLTKISEEYGLALKN
ncbi:MAG: PAS domain S-box protein [Bacteroidota bacterium]|nr:PAS domain S-box protein [Bacteroidota bacterium]